MTFPIPTLDEQHAFLIALSRALFPDIDVSEMSDEWLWDRIQAAAATGGHAHVLAAINDIMPDTSEGSLLRRWATIKGLAVKGATPARKAKALRVSGIAGTAVPDERELVHDTSGLRFKTSGNYIVGPGGYVDVDVVAIDTGSATRLSKGERLTFLVAVAGLSEEAELQLALDEDGTDAELDGSLQRRLLARWGEPPRGGRDEDYVAWALEVTGYDQAYAYPLRAGLGTMHLAALHAGSGSARAPSAPEVAELQALIDTKRPASMKGFKVLLVTAEEVDVEVVVTPDGDAEHAKDWTDSPAPTCDAWDQPTRKLTFAGGARPADMKAGDRLIVKKAAGAGTGQERVIESLDGVDAVILEADPVGDEPAFGDTIYAGGPLVEPARVEIKAYFDALGTANPDAKRYGAWDGTVRLGKLGGAAERVDGVLEATVVTPVAKLDASDPAFPDDDSIGLLVYGRVLVRYA